MFSISSREIVIQKLHKILLIAVAHGEPMPELTELIEGIIRDKNYWSSVRVNAVEALMSNEGQDKLCQIAEDIRSGVIEDQDDDVLGALLNKLYPDFITPQTVLNYLHHRKNSHFFGEYFRFWNSEVPKTKKENLPLLLDELVQKYSELRQIPYEHHIDIWIEKLLVKALLAYGEVLPIKQLYDWLGVGVDKYGNSCLEKDGAEIISGWFTSHPDKYKAIIEYGVPLCIHEKDSIRCIWGLRNKLQNASAPADIEYWYLEAAKKQLVQNNEVARYYYMQAIATLQNGQQKLDDKAISFLKLQSSEPLLLQWLNEYLKSCQVDGLHDKQFAQKTKKWASDHQKRKEEWIARLRENLASVRNGTALPGVMHTLALAYNGSLVEAQGETPSERLSNLLNNDKELIEAAYEGFRRMLDRDDLPSVSEVVESELQNKLYFIQSPCLVGMSELYKNNPIEALSLSDSLLSKLIVFYFTSNMGEKYDSWVTTLIETRPKFVGEVFLSYALPAIKAEKQYIKGLHQLISYGHDSEIIKFILPVLLKSFPLRTSKQLLGNVLKPLLEVGITSSQLKEQILTAIIELKLKKRSMESAQRVYWLSCGFMIAPKLYSVRLRRYIGESQTRRQDLANFLNGHWKISPYTDLDDTLIGLLIELLASDCSPERPTGGGWVVTPEMQKADLVRSLIHELQVNGNKKTHELERLLKLKSLTVWHNFLENALYNKRIALSKASFNVLSVNEICHTLANEAPANPADLAALVILHLEDISRKIRDGDTDDYKQYWSYDEKNKKLKNSKPENDCRDALLSDLKERLSRIDGGREGSYADSARGDIKISFNGFNIPIEIKKDSHPKLWKAIREQLISKYVRDPGTGGYGIYVVFWFGGTGMPLPSDGKKIHNAQDLKRSLQETLTEEEGQYIRICVIDCALKTNS
jgi:hypothetical protein